MAGRFESLLLYVNLAAHGLLLLGAVWSITVPKRRIYPMARRGPAFRAMWILFSYVFVSNAALVMLDWNSGFWDDPLRFALGVPVAALGAALVSSGIASLGLRNTSGVRDSFIVAGPYRFTRNPQYVGDALLFAGMAIIANSQVVLVTHMLTALVLLLAPFAEEPWLKEQYGEEYEAYKRAVPRYL